MARLRARRIIRILEILSPRGLRIFRRRLAYAMTGRGLGFGAASGAAAIGVDLAGLSDKLILPLLLLSLVSACIFFVAITARPGGRRLPEALANAFFIVIGTVAASTFLSFFSDSNSDGSRLLNDIKGTTRATREDVMEIMRSNLEEELGVQIALALDEDRSDDTVMVLDILFPKEIKQEGGCEVKLPQGAREIFDVRIADCRRLSVRYLRGDVADLSTEEITEYTSFATPVILTTRIDGDELDLPLYRFWNPVASYLWSQVAYNASIVELVVTVDDTGRMIAKLPDEILERLGPQTDCRWSFDSGDGEFPHADETGCAVYPEITANPIGDYDNFRTMQVRIRNAKILVPRQLVATLTDEQIDSLFARRSTAPKAVTPSFIVDEVTIGRLSFHNITVSVLGRLGDDSGDLFEFHSLRSFVDFENDLYGNRQNNGSISRKPGAKNVLGGVPITLSTRFDISPSVYGYCMKVTRDDVDTVEIGIIAASEGGYRQTAQFAYLPDNPTRREGDNVGTLRCDRASSFPREVAIAFREAINDAPSRRMVRDYKQHIVRNCLGAGQDREALYACFFADLNQQDARYSPFPDCLTMHKILLRRLSYLSEQIAMPPNSTVMPTCEDYLTVAERAMTQGDMKMREIGEDLTLARTCGEETSDRAARFWACAKMFSLDQAMRNVASVCTSGEANGDDRNPRQRAEQWRMSLEQKFDVADHRQSGFEYQLPDAEAAEWFLSEIAETCPPARPSEDLAEPAQRVAPTARSGAGRRRQ